MMNFIDDYLPLIAFGIIILGMIVLIILENI